VITRLWTNNGKPSATGDSATAFVTYADNATVTNNGSVSATGSDSIGILTGDGADTITWAVAAHQRDAAAVLPARATTPCVWRGGRIVWKRPVATSQSPTWVRPPR